MEGPKKNRKTKEKLKRFFEQKNRKCMNTIFFKSCNILQHGTLNHKIQMWVGYPLPVGIFPNPKHFPNSLITRL